MTQQDSALILVVDDDNLTRIHLCELLAAAGYQVVEASNGSEALAAYTHCQPDLVLLDALMPVMDGFTCCAQLQKLPNADNTPVLMITALYDQASVAEAFAVGATDFITKPIHWPVLSQRVHRLLEANRTMQELRQQTEQAKLREAQLQLALEAACMGVWDWDIVNNKVTWSENKEALLGLEKGAFDGTYESFIRSIHPQDRNFVSYSVTRAVKEGAEYDIEFRAVLPDGSIRWLASKGIVLRNASGVAVRMSGVDVDITKRKQAEAKLESHAQQQAIVAELSQIALAGKDLSSLINSCVTLVAQCLQVESCKVLELLSDGDALLLRAGVGWQQGLVSNASISTLLAQESISVENVHTERRFYESQMLHEQPMVGGVSVVIHGKDRPFGVLGVYTTQEHIFTKDDIYFLEAVANVLATAIERQRVEEALKKSEERASLAVRGNNDGIWDWNVKTNEVFFSTRWKEMLGYEDQEINNDLDEWATRVHPDDLRAVRQAISDHFAKKSKFYISEHRVRCKDGTYKWILDRGQAVWDLDGNVVRMASSHTDITERKLAEEQLRQSEERFQIVARATNDAVWDWDLLTNQVWWNLAVQTLFGYSTEQVNANPYWWLENLHPDDRHRIATDMRAVIDSGKKFWSNEYRFRRSDGSYADIFDRGYVVHDHTGQPVQMIGGMMDISDRKRTQAELQRQNLRSQLFADVTLKIRQSLRIDEILQTSVTEVQKLLQADRVLILRLKSNGSFLTVEEALVPGLPVLLGKQIIDPCFGESYIQKYHEGHIGAVTDIYQADIQPCHIEFLEKFAVRANLVVPIFRQNQLWGLLITHQCYSPRQWTDWEIELLRQLADQIGIALAQSRILEQETRQRLELARSNEELQQFAFIASHDLQEPLRKIKTFGERLQAICGGCLSEQGLDYLERMQNAAQRMETLINDLLILSRVTTRAQPFVAVDLAHITQEVLSDLEVRIEQTRGNVEVGELPTIKADPLQMRQLLQNLIANALKFHRPQVPPVVKISSELINNPSDKIAVGFELCQIIIEDNGIGFEEKYLDRIFNVFQRLHSRRDYEGTGIGLAICRKIVERHYGSITAQSQPGEGARFVVTLPVNLSI
ncbi:MAG: PAS domain-containing protein [Goleter apudmare HA4340-LM2]|jgi:PAS domain S-box-containing protein|nr:PAS domain-containing protein [Goleter apudmare HA4340-LM2]